jgi:hypothetical protein
MKHGCPGPSDMGGVVRARQNIGTTSSLVAVLPARKDPGGWMVWMEGVTAPGAVARTLEVNLDLGRFTQARQFTIPGGGFRIYTVPSSSPVTVRATSRGGTSIATIAAWPVEQVAWANPEFEFPTVTNTAGANFPGTFIANLPANTDRIQVALGSSAGFGSVAVVVVQGVTAASGSVVTLGTITFPGNNAPVINVIPGLFSNIALTSTGVAAGEVITVNGASYRVGR